MMCSQNCGDGEIGKYQLQLVSLTPALGHLQQAAQGLAQLTLSILEDGGVHKLFDTYVSA